MNISVFKKSRSELKSPWCCRWVEYDNGQRKTREKHFASKSKADEYKKQLLDNIKQGRTNYTDSELKEIDHSWSLCVENGLRLSEVVLAGLRALAVDPDAKSRKVPTIEWAIEAYHYDCEKRNLRPDTLKNYRAMLDPFKTGRADRLITTITAGEVVKYIQAKYDAEGSRKNLGRRFSAWLEFCSAKEQKWIQPLPRGALSWKSVQVDRPDPVIYTVDETALLIKKVPDYLKCGVAVGLFAGVRPKELLRIRWNFVDGGGRYGFDFEQRTIRLHPSWVKTRGGRTLHNLPDNLWLWLEKYRKCLPENASKDAYDRLVPIGEGRYYIQMRNAFTAAGIKKIQNGSPAKDVMRHSFASYGRHRGLDWVVDVMGHSGGQWVLHRHYKNTDASPAAADAYFSIVPD